MSGANDSKCLREPPERIDPYLESLRNKDIRFILGISTINVGKVDTIELDREGKIVRLDKLGGSERRSYDACGFLVKRCKFSDFVASYTAKYTIANDTLIRTWGEFADGDCDAVKGDALELSTTIFILDEKGQIMEEIDRGTGRKHSYRYENGCLIQRVDGDSGDFYDYDHDRKLIKYTRKFHGKIIEEYNFQDGIIESSSIYNFPDGSLIQQNKYRYLYYH
jgi:hypothetical protein